MNLPTLLFCFTGFRATSAAAESEPTLTNLLIFHRIIKMRHPAPDRRIHQGQVPQSVQPAPTGPGAPD